MGSNLGSAFAFGSCKAHISLLCYDHLFGYDVHEGVPVFLMIRVMM